MSTDNAELRTRFEGFWQNFEELRANDNADQSLTDDERTTLDRIQAKLEDIRARLEHAGSDAPPHAGQQAGKADRKGRLSTMRNSIAALMTSLKRAR